ncbi:MAG TPA: WG repeat-containing protein [Polyangiaceae bacterium]
MQDADHKVGFLDVHHRLIVPPQFDFAEPASEGLTAVRQGAGSGFLSANGQWAIAPTLSEVSPFSEGLAVAAVRKSGRLRYGFIDHSGSWVVPAQFDMAHPFREGLAQVWASRVEQYVDHTGKVAFILPAGCFSDEFHGGLTRILRNDLFGYADRRGQIVIAPRFKDASNFSEGLAAAKEGASWGFIDTQGTFRIPPRFVQVGAFSAGRAVAALSDHEFGFVTRKGVLSGNYLVASDYRNGFAAVLIAEAPGRERWGFIDTQGTLAVKPKYERIEGGFQEGLVAVAEPQRDFGYIDERGEYVIEPRFTFARAFNGGIALVQQAGTGGGPDQFGYIDRRGAFVWGPFPFR